VTQLRKNYYQLGNEAGGQRAERENGAARQGRVLVPLHLSPRTFLPFLIILSGLPCWLPFGRVWLMEMRNKTETNFQNEHWPKEGIKYES